MFKIMLRPFFKRFIGLFISMVFVSMLSVALLVSFSSAMTNLKSNYTSYKRDYGAVDALITTDFSLKNNLPNIHDVKGVDQYDTRFTMDCFLKKQDGRTITSRVFTYDDEYDDVFKRYIIEDGGAKEDAINVSIVRKFAKNNNFKLGDTISLGYASFFVDMNVASIIETPEAIYVRATDYIWSDNQDFGFIYIDQLELDKMLVKLVKKLTDDPEFKKIYDEIRTSYGVDLPDLDTLITVGERYASNFCNQILIKAKKGFTQKEVLDNVLKALEGKVNVKSSTIGNDLLYEKYMSNAMKQLTIGSLFLPIFFYLVTMVVISLFLNQIIQAMTQDIGIMMSIGISPKEIRGIFLLFTLLMTIAASLLGIGIAFGLHYYLATIFISAYNIPTIPFMLNPWVCILAAISMMIVGEGACFLSCFKVFRITPKDAMLSNETKRKPLPKWLNNMIDKSPMNIKLATNSIAQNPRRFFVSTFSIFAAMTMILVTGFFHVSKDEMLNQTLNRRMNYDCQVYMMGKDDGTFYESLKGKDFVEEVQECYFTYLKVNTNNNEYYLETLATPKETTRLVNIPDKKGKNNLSIPEKGIILAENDAKRMGVKVGDKISVNNHEIEVVNISKQYFHMTQYMSMAQMEELEISFASSYLIDATNEQVLLDYLVENNSQCLTVFTKSLKADMNGIFSAVDVFIIILIIFSLGMGFVILTIMSQNALMEQKRQISVMRAIGFRIINISNIWTLLSLLQSIFALVLAIPVGLLVSNTLFSLASSSTQIYPFIIDWKIMLFAFLFVALVIIISHTISMISIRGWNLADNTRSRE